VSHRTSETWIAYLNGKPIHFHLMTGAGRESTLTFDYWPMSSVCFTAWITMDENRATVDQAWVGYFNKIFHHTGHTVITEETCVLNLGKEAAE